MKLELRYVTYVNKYTTKDIQNLRNRTGCGIWTAKNYLEDKKISLEYLDENGKWTAVPSITIEREIPSTNSETTDFKYFR